MEAEITDSYYNMREKIAPAMFLIDNAKAAMEAEGVTPIISPIRGGTDGARLSDTGLPCPNLCTGGHNFHGRYEFICVQSMGDGGGDIKEAGLLFCKIMAFCMEKGLLQSRSFSVFSD